MGVKRNGGKEKWIFQGLGFIFIPKQFINIVHLYIVIYQIKYSFRGLHITQCTTYSVQSTAYTVQRTVYIDLITYL